MTMSDLQHSSPDLRRRFRLVVAAVLLASAMLTGCEVKTKPVASSNQLNTEAEFRRKVAELRMEKTNLERAIARMEKNKQESVEFLAKKGVKSLADVGDDDALKYAVRNLKADTDEIARLKENIGAYDKAIMSITGMLAEIERKRINDSVSLSDDDYLQLRKIEVDLKERLGMDKKDILEDERLNELLKSEMKASSDDPDGQKQ